MLNFSIIITTYNRSDLLQRAVASVFNQTYGGFELIIVDDASTDDNLIEQSEISWDKLEYIRHEHNQGVSAARNTGIKAARYPYIVFLDDDDVFHDNYLEKLLGHLEKFPDIDFTWCGKKNRIFENSVCVEEKEFYYSANSYDNKDVCPMLNYWANSLGVMIKKNVFNKIGLFDTNLTTAEDLDLLLRMLNAGMQFVAIPDILIDVNIYKSRKSLSRQSTSQVEANNLSLMLKTNEKFLSKNRGIWAYYAKSLIMAYYRCGEKYEARKLMARLLKFRPTMCNILIRAFKYEFIR
ncbi:MAG: glycosyltransferase family 2 protein [Desulfobacteraceae bacterium]|nr:glycosyltransferase family 2 protein [Desulfobacteraceae bacterium]